MTFAVRSLQNTVYIIAIQSDSLLSFFTDFSSIVDNFDRDRDCNSKADRHSCRVGNNSLDLLPKLNNPAFVHRNFVDVERQCSSPPHSRTQRLLLARSFEILPDLL